MISKSDLAPEEQETVGNSKDSSVHTTEEATIYVKDLDMFVEVQLLKESPVVLSMGK